MLTLSPSIEQRLYIPKLDEFSILEYSDSDIIEWLEIIRNNEPLVAIKELFEMSLRLTEGKETWRRLRDWSSDKATSERLSAQILRQEGYMSIDPSHPLGGPDGLKDVVCSKDGKRWIGAAYFPNKQMTLAQIKRKFSDDFVGVSENNADGIAFITNQEITLGDREEIRKLAIGTELELYHLERVSSILDSPSCYGIRLEYLRIEMSVEEQIAFVHAWGEFTEKMDRILAHLKAQERAMNISSQPTYVTPDYTIRLSIASGEIEKVHNCSFCGFGYIVNNDSSIPDEYPAAQMMLSPTITCPKCGNMEKFRSGPYSFFK